MFPCDLLEPTPAPEEVSVFDSIQPVRHEEPTDAANATRIAFRLNDGSRLVHKFSKDAKVRALFEYIKSEVEDARSQSFEVGDRLCLLDNPVSFVRTLLTLL